MPSSLAAQLAQSTSLNAGFLNEKSRRKATESYLFTGRDADQYDLETIHALAVNAYIKLCQLSSGLRQYEQALFSDSAKALDRTLRTKDENAKLDDVITNFTQSLAPYVMEAPTARVIEWLVRRFRVHEFNVEAVLTMFLPYHESPHFAKMVTILHIQPNSTWRFLLAHKAAAKSVPRASLVIEMSKNSAVARFVAALHPEAIKKGRGYRTLTAFHLATLHDYVASSDNIDEGTIACLLPACLDPLQTEVTPGKDEVLASYILLAALSQKCSLSSDALKVIITAMTKRADQVHVNQFLSIIVAVCEPHEELETLPSSVVKCLLKISDFPQELNRVLPLVGVDKFINPLLSGMCKRLEADQAQIFLETLCTSPDTPQTTLLALSSALIRHVISSNDTQTSRRILGNLNQRRPAVVKQVARQLSSNEELKSSVDQLMLALTIPISGVPSTTKSDLLLAVNSFDENVRSNAVAELLSSVGKANDPQELESIHNALLLRLLDSEASVIEVLYSKPAVIIPVILANFSTYLSTLTAAICTEDPGSKSKPKRTLIRLHLAFAASNICPSAKDNAVTEKIFHALFVPFLLYSKPRQRTTESVWEILNQSKSDGKDEWMLWKYEWLSGSLDIWAAGKDVGKDAEQQHEMSALNLALANKISESIMISNRFEDHLDMLTTHMRSANSHVRVSAHLLSRSLLTRLSGEHLFIAASKIIKGMDIDDPMETAWYSIDEPTEAINDDAVGRALVTKPSSQNTLRLLQISILALLATAPRPVNTTVDWFNSAPVTSGDTRGQRYVEHMHSIYRLANLYVPVAFTIHILSLLFNNLAEHSLAFLASIWLLEPAPGADKDRYNQLRLAALRHGAAFLEAHQEDPSPVDFQTILPSLLIAMQSSDLNVRRAAVDCIVVLSKSTIRPFTSIYAVDWIYGKETDKLQFVDQSDLKKYLESIAEDHEHIVHDESYAQIFHERHLGVHGGKKKQVEYRRRILCFLLSHVVSLASVQAKVNLLKLIKGISDKCKMDVLRPNIKTLADTPFEAQIVLYGSLLEDYTTLLLSSVDLSLCSELNDLSGALWPFFTSLVQRFFSAESVSGPRLVITENLKHGLFAGLNLQRQLSISELLLAEGTKSSSAHASVKALFMDLPLDASLLTELISHLLSPASSTAVSPPSKRAKVSEPKTDTLASFSILAEILASKTLPTSIDLVVRLIESLNNVLQIAPTAQSDLSFVEQLLMLAIENVADKINDVPNSVPSSIRLDVLVEVVRVARNPQTFHQALMLIAGLTRLAPDSVLHNVMPIFTFMGSNVFHRDDEYSFRVVQKTIDSIVPVMASSLKEKHDGLGLYINARDFLRVFTEASSHIPRHRRTNFFIHLVDVLGANVFLPPVTMFLATKSLRSRGQTEESAFSLVNSIVHHYGPDLQTTTLVEALKESQRLLQAYVDPSAVAFLADPSDDESTVFLTRAQLLISFVGQCAKAHSASATSSASTTELVHILISLAQVKHPEHHVHFEDIRRSAKDSLNRFLTVVPAVDFISAALAMLQSADSEIHDGALELLTDRLGHISDSVRRQNSSIFIHIISHIKAILHLNQTNLSLGCSCLKALQAIAQSTCEGEESALTSVVPLLILIVRARTLGQVSVSVISSLVPKLGPRIIPFFRELVTEIVALIRHAGVDSVSVEALRSLVTTIPTFWSSNELVQVISFHVDTNNSNDPRHSPATGLIISLAKRIPSRALLSALIDFWSMPGRTQWEESAIVGLFDVVKRALHVAVKNDVVDLTKPLFKMFLSAFEAVINEAVDQSDGEGAVISAFMELVIKLNDSAFRPLFRRLYDWAFAEDSDTSRRITFLHNYIALLDFFKSLMTPYMSFLLPPFITSLKQSDTDDSTLNYRLCLVKTITKSLMLDDGAFWRDDKLRQVAQPLIQQLPTFATMASPIAHSTLLDCLVALGDCTTDDTLLKNLNIDVLMHTRSENSKVRIEALQCSASLWHAIGGKLLGFVPETTTFIAECAEDEHDLVVEEARNLKNAVESVAGRIDV